MAFCNVKIFFKQRDAKLIYTALKLCKVFFRTPGSTYENILLKISKSNAMLTSEEP